MDFLATSFILLALFGLVFYARWIILGFQEDNRENTRMTPDLEREQWIRLWDRMQDLPDFRRAFIRKLVAGLITQSEQLNGIGRDITELSSSTSSTLENTSKTLNKEGSPC